MQAALERYLRRSNHIFAHIYNILSTRSAMQYVPEIPAERRSFQVALEYHPGHQ